MKQIATKKRGRQLILQAKSNDTDTYDWFWEENENIGEKQIW